MPANAAQASNEADVRAVVEAWARAIRNEDMAGVLARHADAIVMFDVPAPLQNRGLDAYRQAWELFFAAQGKGAFNLGELVIVAGDDVAFCHSIVTCGGLEPASQFPVRLTLGLRKIDGAWTVTHEHHSVPAG
jgi:uncharacterized protein (TIGR02246 family)